MYEFIQTKTGWKVCFGPLPVALVAETAIATETGEKTPIRTSVMPRRPHFDLRQAHWSEERACELATAG